MLLVYLAAQSWCLAVNLPLLIGNVVPEDDRHYQCYLILLAILSISMAVAVGTEDTCLLSAMIEDHHRRFILLYEHQSFTPKLHYMVHLPQQLLR